MANKIQQLFFSHFQKNEDNKNALKKKSDSLSQPKSKSDMSPEDKKNNRNKLIKKLVIWVLVLGGLAAIIAPIVVTSTKKTTNYLSGNTIVSVNNSNNVEFKDGDSTYIVNLNSNPLLQCYYSSTSNKINLNLKTTNSTLPISIIVERDKVDTNYIYTIGQIVITADAKTNMVSSVVQGSNIEENPVTNQQLWSNFANLLRTAYTNAITASPGFNWLGLLSSLLPLLILILLFVFYGLMIKKQMGGGQDSIFGIGKLNTKPVKTNVHFRDVAGIDEVKDELKEIVDFVKNSSKYAAMGARAPKGVILYGPPGTGKTLIAKAVAGEANCAFFPVSGSSFDDMLVGVGAKRVRDLFAKARKFAPAIIFIDEIDSVASKRGKNDVIGGGSGVADQTINQLLAEMDGFSTDSGVIVIAATNRLDVLDEAILRPGRFDRQIQVTLPDIKGREAILKIHSKNKNLSSKIKLVDVARRTPGFSGAQLENVLNEATLLAVRRKSNVIGINDIDEAIDRVIGGPARHGRVISEYERKQIAYHEAGHALVGLHTEDTEIVQKITIIPRGNAAGYTLQTPAEQEKTIQRKKEILNQVRMTLGGRAAEECIYGPDNITSGAANDLYKVTNMVRAMVMQLGMTDVGMTQFIPTEGNHSPLEPRLYSENTAVLIDKEIEKIIQEEYKNAKDIINNNSKELELIVETLLLLETIVKEQIDYIHEHLELPKEALEVKQKLEQDNSKTDTNDKDKIEDENNINSSSK